jgi:hypothetical protein
MHTSSWLWQTPEPAVACRLLLLLCCCTWGRRGWPLHLHSLAHHAARSLLTQRAVLPIYRNGPHNESRVLVWCSGPQLWPAFISFLSAAPGSSEEGQARSELQAQLQVNRQLSVRHSHGSWNARMEACVTAHEEWAHHIWPHSPASTATMPARQLWLHAAKR